MCRYAAVVRRAILAVGLVLAGCRDPTQITIELTTDVPCDELRATSITVGELGAIETKPAAATESTCSAGTIGSLVAVPAGAGPTELAFKMVSSIGTSLDGCTAPDYGYDCIVARRALNYKEHTSLRVPVVMRDACRGTACLPTETCALGRCVPATVDVNRCASAAGCGEDTLVDDSAPVSTGAARWAKTWGSSADDRGRAVATDADGNVCVTGSFEGTLTVDDALLSVDGRAAFLMCFTSDGTLRWARSFGSAVEAYALAVAADGDIYTAGGPCSCDREVLGVEPRLR